MTCDDVRIVLQSLDSVDSLPRARCLSLHVKRIALRVCTLLPVYPLGLLTLAVTFQRTLNTHDFSVHCSGVKKILLFPETWTKKNRVGMSGFFYNGAYKYTKLLHTFLSLLSSSYIVL